MTLRFDFNASGSYVDSGFNFVLNQPGRTTLKVRIDDGSSANYFICSADVNGILWGVNNSTSWRLRTNSTDITSSTGPTPGDLAGEVVEIDISWNGSGNMIFKVNGTQVINTTFDTTTITNILGLEDLRYRSDHCHAPLPNGR